MSYEQVLENIHYRFIFGRMSVITPDMTKNNIGNQHSRYPAELERSFVKEIKEGNYPAIEGLVKKTMDEIVKFSYNSIIFSIFQIVNVIS